MQDKWLTDVAGLCGVQTRTTDLSPETSWRYMPYETMDGIKGTMIISSAVGDFRDLTLPLPSVGPCRIYIGIGCFGDFTRIKLRLGGESQWRLLRGRGINWFPECIEYLYREADLHGQPLEIRNAQEISTLAWIRLEPMTERPADHKYHCVATMDGYWTDTLATYYDRIASFAGGNIGRLQFCLGESDVVSHFTTKVGTNGFNTMFGSHMTRLHHDITLQVNKLREEEPQLVPKLIDFTHRHGMEFFGSIRLGACYMPGLCNYSEFFQKHLEYHCRTRNGTPVARLSFAEPEVRNHFLQLFDEMTDFDLDGLNLILMRSVPLIAFESAFRNAFHEKYGVSPLEIPEDDPRIITLRSNMITDFLRDIRKLLDDKGKKRGRRFVFSIDVLATPAANHSFGLDLETLVAEKIIDSLEVDGALMKRNHDEKIANIDYAYFGKLCAGTDCRWYPKGEDNGGGEQFPKMFNDAVSNGASGLFLWDVCDHTAVWPRRWETLTNLMRGVEPAVAPERLHLLRTLDGFDYDQFTPHNGF